MNMVFEFRICPIDQGEFLIGLKAQKELNELGGLDSSIMIGFLILEIGLVFYGT